MVPVSGIVLAGGKSLRLGRVKALERINNQLLIERTIERISPPARPVLVVTSQEQFDLIVASHLKVKVVLDLFPGKGALGGIYTGLECADSFYSLIVGCDMPFLNRSLLRYITRCATGFDAVVPKMRNMLEPLHAVYSKNCLPLIRKMMEEDRLEILQLFDMVNTRYLGEEELVKIDSEGLSFFNINTMADLRKARQLARRHSLQQA
ncbi:MAG TPA: molybdenum cofactor guanylyltransferase [Dehalococcoidia bacterium]